MYRSDKRKKINTRILQVLYDIARWRPWGALVGWGYAKMAFALPVNRIRETESFSAFFHPRPSYPFHVLLVPKRWITDLSDLSKMDGDFIRDLFLVAESIVQEYGLKQFGYRLIMNGGEYQEIAQVHFHLVADRYSGSSSS